MEVSPMYLGCDLPLPVTLEIALQFRKCSDGNLLVKLLWERSMTCSLDKPKFIYIGPWNPFARKTRIYNSSKDFNQKGNVSFNLLFPRFRTSIILHLTNDREIFPCIWLCFKSNVLKLHPFMNVSGKFPWKWLFLIANTTRELLELSKHCGI